MLCFYSYKWHTVGQNCPKIEKRYNPNNPVVIFRSLRSLLWRTLTVRGRCKDKIKYVLSASTTIVKRLFVRLKIKLTCNIIMLCKMMLSVYSNEKKKMHFALSFKRVCGGSSLFYFLMFRPFASILLSIIIYFFFCVSIKALFPVFIFLPSSFLRSSYICLFIYILRYFDLHYLNLPNTLYCENILYCFFAVIEYHPRKLIHL